MIRISSLVLASAIASVPCIALASITINAQGTFRDLGVWLYENPNHTFGFGPATAGTNERIDMPPPSPPAGGSVAGIEVIKHPFDTLGYPLHISLVDKLYAAHLHLPIDVGDNGQLWTWSPGMPAALERSLDNGSTTNVTAFGPIPAADAIPAQYQAAFQFATQALASISNMPAEQKQLANYVVLFIVTNTTVWVEFGPVFGQGETEHLGCQTSLGRDMVFGYQATSPNGSNGLFLQCF